MLDRIDGGDGGDGKSGVNGVIPVIPVIWVNAVIIAAAGKFISQLNASSAA
jgi:hypothetical protein